MTKNGRRVLLVGDDLALGQALDEHLTAAGFVVTLAGAAEAAAKAVDADVVVVDGDATLCQGIKHSIVAPVLALTKPVRLAALVARIEDSLARRQNFTLGPWRFDASARILEDGGRLVRLTDKEAAILRWLCQSAEVVPRDLLLAEVWGYGAAIATHTLETHIYRLRRKIEADPANPSLLLTEPGGYRVV